MDHFEKLELEYTIRTLKESQKLVSQGHTKHVIHKVAPYCIDRWAAEDALEPFIPPQASKLQKLIAYDFAILEQESYLTEVSDGW